MFEKYVALVDEKGKTHAKTRDAEAEVQEITNKLQQRGKGEGSVELSKDQFESLHRYKMK